MIDLPSNAITHGGRFHADDVFSAALLRIMNPEIKIRRAFRVPEDFSGLAFDLGCGSFDHHQSDAEVRPNGVPYAAFGLLWREFGASLVGEAEALRFDEHFVQPLDLDDNTGCGSDIAAVIGSFNPSWDSKESPDDCFSTAVDIAQAILSRRIEGANSVRRAQTLVQAALEKAEDNIVVLPRFAPWKMTLSPSTAEFVVYPSQRGGYSAQGVPTDDAAHSLKVQFPAVWAGRTEEELPELSGIPSLRFCHNNGFLIAAGTLADTVAACKLAQKESRGR